MPTTRLKLLLACSFICYKRGTHSPARKNLLEIGMTSGPVRCHLFYIFYFVTKYTVSWKSTKSHTASSIDFKTYKEHCQGKGINKNNKLKITLTS